MPQEKNCRSCFSSQWRGLPGLPNPHMQGVSSRRKRRDWKGNSLRIVIFTLVTSMFRLCTLLLKNVRTFSKSILGKFDVSKLGVLSGVWFLNIQRNSKQYNSLEAQNSRSSRMRVPVLKILLSNHFKHFISQSSGSGVAMSTLTVSPAFPGTAIHSIRPKVSYIKMSPPPQIAYKLSVTINVPMALPVPWHPGVPLNVFTRSWGHLITVSFVSF